MSQLLRIESPASVPGPTGLPLLRLGFRPFYLLAALHALLLVPFWVLVHRGALAAPAGLPPVWWHAHEMVYGFAFAVVAGFLFTAVRNWTGQPTPTGWRLGALALSWVAVRVLLLLGFTRAGLLLEMIFLLLVSVALLVPLVRAANRRNYFVGLLPLVLLAADSAVYAATYVQGFPVTADTMLRLALYLIVLLTGVIGGRVIPMFTLNAVRGLRQFKDARLDRAALAATAVALACDVAGMSGAALLVIALAAAGLQAARLWGWRPLATGTNPLVWILHVSYAWTVIGLVLLALSSTGWIPRALALHAFGLGLVGGLIIGMVTRTALGHTGRMLVAGRAETAMFVLVPLAAALRVFGPLIAPDAYLSWVAWAAVPWSLAFLLYLWVYGPRLCGARVDGRDG